MQSITIWRVKCLDREGMMNEFLFDDKAEFNRFVSHPKSGCAITDIIEKPTVDADRALDLLLNPAPEDE